MSDETKKRPAFQFYPGDWRKDVQLRACTIAARGLWIDLMCVMHDCEPYGHLVLNGKPMSAAQMAGQIGLAAAQVKKLLDELIENGVARVTDAGVIYSKRMVDDERLRLQRAETGRANGHKGAEHGSKGAEYGARGGRPSGKKVGENGGGNGGEEPWQKPPQNPRPSSSSSSSLELLPDEANASSSSPDSATPGAVEPACPYGDIVAAYGELLPMLPAVRIVTERRKREMRKRWAWVLSSRKSSGERRATTPAEAMAWFRDYFARCAADPFINGTAPRGKGHEGWEADISYLMRDDCLVRIAEKTPRN